MQHSPLDAVHRTLGAKLVDFGGWEMPLAYPSGTIAEHEACRTSSAVFDVSHLGTLQVRGSDAMDLLQRVLTNDLGRIAPGRAQYTHLLDPGDASVVDDIIVWWLSDDHFHVIPNASNTAEVSAILEQEAAGRTVQVLDSTAERAMVAVQGPDARRVVASVSEEAAGVGRFRVVDFVFEGVGCMSAGTGYTGEDGVECYVPVGAAESFWEAITAAGAVPAGLGARDTLRLEAGFPLHGHELGSGLTPLNAGLGWVVSWDKGDFRGREALAAQRDAGGYRTMRGLVTEGRRPPRAGQGLTKDGEEVGVITSGNFSPTLGHGIALAMVEPTVTVGDTLEIDLRGRSVEANVVELPFYRAPSP